MNTKTDHSFTLLAAVIVAGVIAAFVSPTRAHTLAQPATSITAGAVR